MSARRAMLELLKPLHRRIGMMVARVRLTLVDDGPGVQVLQLDGLVDETLQDIERFGQYGFTSTPKAGAEAILVAVGGTRSQGVVIAVEDRRYRLRAGAPGEVAVHDDQGQVVHLKRDGILITSPFKVQVEAPQVDVITEAATITADSAKVISDAVVLGAEGGKAVVVHGDDVVAGKCVASTSKVTAA